MNYYPFHIGDYLSHTAHLEPMEDIAYRRILDLYRLREGDIPKDPAEVSRLVRMKDYLPQVESVLSEFFDRLPDGRWSHTRRDLEILDALESDKERDNALDQS